MDNINKIDLIKRYISIEDILAMYGVSLDYKNMCECLIHKDTQPSMKVYNDGHFYCFGCGEYGDVIDLFKKIQGITTKEAIEILFEKFGLGLASPKQIATNHKILKKEKPKASEKKHFINPKVIQYVKSCEALVNKTDYFKKRGLLPRTIKRFRLGYDEIENAVVIPYNKALTYYQRRYVAQKRFYKIPDSICGSEPIFNFRAFEYAKIIFIVESPICAISISQCGGTSVSLCGVANTRKLLRYLNKNYYDGVLILSLDNDEAGKKATQELINGIAGKAYGLEYMHIKYKVVNIADECKDPNELLVKQWSRLRRNVQQLIYGTQKELEK